MKPFAKTPHKVLTVTIDEAGDLLYLKSDSCDVLLECGEVVQKRASHVEPDNAFLRVAFHFLRFFCHDDSRLAGWTRGWKVLWRVNTAPVGGPILRYKHLGAAAAFDAVGLGFSVEDIVTWTDRKQAIDAEIEFLNDFFLERGI